MGKNAHRRVGLAWLREQFADRQPRPCEYCGKPCINGTDRGVVRLATVDHRVPFSRGGTDAIANLAIACYKCNHLKGPLTEDEFLRFRHDLALLKQWRDMVTLSITRGVRRQHEMESRTRVFERV